MYSIHDTVKDESPSQLAEEQPDDMMWILDDFSYLYNLPKYDQYDDDYELPYVQSKMTNEKLHRFSNGS